MDNVGKRLKNLRITNKYTQKQIGDYLGFDQSHIAKLENNKRKLQSKSLKKLCILYNCSESYINEGEGSYAPNDLNFRSNSYSLDINTIVNMNTIMRNLSILTEYDKTKCENNSKSSIYNKYKTSDINFNAKECRNLWNINENEPIDIINVCLNKFTNTTIVFFIANENMSGASAIINGEIIIFINSNHTLGRQRFTIAHELYHILYGNGDFVDCSLKKFEDRRRCRSICI